MIRRIIMVFFASSSLAFLSALPAYAGALKCSDAKKNLEENIYPVVEQTMKSAFPSFTKEYTIDYTKFYPVDETENSKECVATVGLTLENGLHSESDVKYRLVETEDGQVLTQYENFNWRGLVAGIVSASIRKAQNGMPADEAAKELHAPQGPGSFAEQMRKYNREGGSAGARKSPPQE